MNLIRPGLLISCILLSVWMNAQVVNMESARMQSDSIGWLGNVSSSVSFSKNYIQVFSADADLHVQYKSKKSLYLFLGSYGFLKGDGQKLMDNAFFHIRYNYKLSKVVRWEVFTQLQQNVINGIQSRFLLGSGPRFKLLDRLKIKFYTGTLFMYERESETTGTIPIQRNVRLSSYISFTIAPSRETEIISTTYFQPLVGEWNDYRFLNQLSFRVKAGKRLGIRLNWDYLNDSRPVAGIPSVIYKLSTGFDFNL